MGLCTFLVHLLHSLDFGLLGRFCVDPSNALFIVSFGMLQDGGDFIG